MSKEALHSLELKDEIVKNYFNTVYKLALAMTKHTANAEDVTQEVFLRCFRKDIVFESEEHIKAWLIRVTINCSKNLFASSWFKKTVPLEEDIKFDSPEKGDVYFAVLSLPPKYCTAIHLFYYEDYKISEIAKILNESESAIKSRLSRGRDMLKTKLKGEYGIV